MEGPHQPNEDDDATGNKSLVPSSLSGSLNFFPYKLHQILSTPEFNDIICWLPHGRAWRIQQQDRLETEVLPRFFQHQKYSSFYRQVYGWGFHRILSGPDYNGFYHELFLRDSPELSFNMRRPSKVELAERRQTSLVDSPPNFYLAPPETGSVVGVMETSYSTSVTRDEYWDGLMSRLSGFSLQEKNLYLLIELDRLEKDRSEALSRLQLLRKQSREQQLILPREIHRHDTRLSPNRARPQVPIQPTMMQPQQQLRASLDPWIQKAAESIALERQLRFLHSEKAEERYREREGGMRIVKEH